MKFLKWAGIGLVALVVIALGVGFFLPRAVHVERSAVIARPQATIYTVLADWRQFNSWSPWFEMDPEAEYAYEGETGAVGSKIAWKGKKAGTGSQELIELRPHEKIVSKLVFGEAGEKGEDGMATATLTLEDVDGGTEVTWSFDYETGSMPWERYIGLMMDGMVGPEYEKGLEKLKTYAEALPEADFAGLRAEIVDVEPMAIAYMTMRTTTDPEAVGAAYKEGYAAVLAFMQENNLTPAGMPMGITTTWDRQQAQAVFDAALPISGTVESPADGPVKLGSTYGGRALRVIHTGSYAGLEETYEKAAAYLAAHRMESAGRSWEHFVTDPGEVAEAELVTHIYFPLK